LIFLVFFVCAISAADLHKKFENYKTQYGKSYSQEENAVRFENFVNAVNRIDAKNKQGGATFGLNKFSDLSTAEFRSQYLTSVPVVPANKRPVVPKPTVAAPTSMDWRNNGVVSAVKNQEQCGSCWAFSATETIESAWMMAKNVKNTTFAPLAPQQIVDCDNSDGGCNGGNPYTAYQYVISAGGLDKSSAYPYTGMDGTCAFKPNAVGATISNWQYACEEEDEATLLNNVATKGPLSICVDAQNWQDYTSGIMTGWQCAWINVLDHCVQAVGFDTTASTPYWIVRNSWGADWGEAGYIMLQYGDNTCGLTNEATYVIV